MVSGESREDWIPHKEGELRESPVLTFPDFIVMSSVTLFLQAKIFVPIQSYFSLPPPFLYPLF